MLARIVDVGRQGKWVASGTGHTASKTWLEMDYDLDSCSGEIQARHVVSKGARLGRGAWAHGPVHFKRCLFSACVQRWKTKF